MIKSIISILFFAFISLLLSCSSVDNQNTETQSFFDTEWMLVEIKGKALDLDKYKDKMPYIVFTAGDSSFKGFSGCNRMFGNFKSDGNKIDIDDIGSTKIYCEDNVESDFFDVLRNTVKYKISGDYLFLYDEKDKLSAKLSAGK